MKREIQAEWVRVSPDMWKCYFEGGLQAAGYSRSLGVLLSGTVDTIVGSSTWWVSYDEAQTLLAFHDLTLPPLPEANDG